MVNEPKTRPRTSKKSLTSTNFNYRLLSALVLAPLALFIIYLGGFVFDLATLALCIMISAEWSGMVVNSKTKQNYYAWLPVIIIVSITTYFCFWLMRMHPYGLQMLYWLLLVVWATDTGAYIVGKLIGGPKLAPIISPNKTWSGSIGGIVMACIVSLIFTYCFSNALHPLPYTELSIIISIVGQVGDLLESAMKRRFGIKDSGRIIPGHGGVLDRIDSLVTALFAAVIILYGFF
jgi:phosphatidate cytidylyltransferase